MLGVLSQLTCRSFRNLEDTHWQPGPGCHLVLGPNGAGKTSLLEAIYVLATTRSFRTSRILDCPRHGSGEFHLEGEIEGDQRFHLETGLAVAAGRYRGVNGRTSSLIDHLRVLPIVAWTAEDTELLHGPPERRRRFLDQGIVGTRPAALEVLARFRRCLVQKRQLLARGGKGLASWNEILAGTTNELMILRRQYVEDLSVALDRVLATCDLDLREVSLEYRPSIQVDDDRVEDILAVLEEASRNERREARPLVGPQRDEVVIRWGGHQARRVLSAGERKLLGLLLTAARARVLENAGRSPILLLDDVDSELDEERLTSVLGCFQGVNQTFVSSSRRSPWRADFGVTRWELKAGRLSPENGLQKAT